MKFFAIAYLLAVSALSIKIDSADHWDDWDMEIALGTFTDCLDDAAKDPDTCMEEFKASTQ